MPRKTEESLLDEIHELFKVTPVWVGPVVAFVTFVVFRFVVPSLLPHGQPGMVDPSPIWRPLVTFMSWLAPAAVLVAWLAAEIWKLSNRRLLDHQSGIESIRNLSWQQFERLVSEAYRRQGYTAVVVDTPSGDGGIDIKLTRPGESVLVQCKQWKAFKVGVTTIREILGVVVSEKATKGIIVTSGRFTAEAKNFAQANQQIELIEGPELAALIEGVRSTSPAPNSVPPTPPTAVQPTPSPACPNCGTGMVLRTARRGSNPGSQFWGCPKYPGCTGTRPLVHS